MRNLAPYDNSTWLYADEGRLRQDAIRAASVACFTGPQIGRHHKKTLKALRANLAFASVSEAVAHAGMPGGTLCMLDSRGDGLHPQEAQLAGDKAIRAVKGRVGIIGIHGPLQQRTTSEMMKLGGTSTDFVSAALNQLLADPA